MPTQQLVRHLSLAWKRLARVVFVFLLLGGGLQGQESARNVLVVVPPRGATAQGREVEQVVDMLKAARKELGLKSQELPILRLSLRQERPAQVLQALGINATGNPQVLLCRRGSDGWPELLLGQLSGGENPLLFVRSAVRDPERRELPSRDDEPVLPPRQEVESTGLAGGPEPREDKLAPTGQLGLLLAYRAEDKEFVQPFLSELGRHWMERYGRVKPSPFPLASYDLSDDRVEEALRGSFPELVSDPKPKVALCYFQLGRPVKILEVVNDLTLPATTVRLLSAARHRHMAESISVTVDSSAPAAKEMSLSDDQEQTVRLSRVHELAQRLAYGSSDPEPANRLAHRTLLQIVELTRGSDEDRVLSHDLREALADYESEPLLLEPDSSLRSFQDQFLELIRTLIY